MASSIQSSKSKTIRKGLAIYKPDRSPYWYARVWNPYSKKYVVRSTEETSRLEAKDIAEEFADSLIASKFKNVKSNAPASFKTYADKLLFQKQQLHKGQSQSYVYSDTNKILYRKHDGLIAYFGNMNIRDITAGSIRDYITALDASRRNPLANSTKNKQLNVLKQVLELAFDDEVIPKVPRIKHFSIKSKPRPSFTRKTFKRFMDAAWVCISDDYHKVRGHVIDWNDVHMFQFMAESYVRPTVSELFSLKQGDVRWLENPDRLEVTIRKGKTGARTIIVNPVGKVWWSALVGARTKFTTDESLNSYLVMPAYQNRTTAREKAGAVFNHILKMADLDCDQYGQKLTMYSIRHYAIQERIRTSGGQVNIYWLSKNAGTSVQVLEDFYLKNMELSKEQIKNIHYGLS